MAGKESRAGEAEWLTLGAAARYLGVAESTLRTWADKGHVRSIRTPGHHRRFRRRDLDVFLHRSGRRRGGRVVLIVDDDAGVRALVRAILEPEGYTVREAATASDSLTALAGRPPDLILLDVRMPEIDGWRMLQLVQERRDPIPVIMFGGKVDGRSAARAATEGVHEFIGKPFDPEQVVERVKQLLPA
jgi:excisionase family DNA binding protein